MWFIFPVSNPGENIEMRPLNPNATNQDQDGAVQNLDETAGVNGGENPENEGKKLST